MLPANAQAKMADVRFGMQSMVWAFLGSGGNLLKSVAQDSTKFVKKVK